MNQNSSLLKIFLCHGSEDKHIVRIIYDRLKMDGFSPWLDEWDILGGQDWDLEIKRAVRASDAILVFLSGTSVSKSGYVQKEIKFALDVADEKPEGAIFIIPVKLDECFIPDRLSKWHWIDYAKESGYDHMKRALSVIKRQPVSEEGNDKQTNQQLCLLNFDVPKLGDPDTEKYTIFIDESPFFEFADSRSKRSFSRLLPIGKHSIKLEYYSYDL